MILIDERGDAWTVHFFHTKVHSDDPEHRHGSRKTIATIHKTPCQENREPNQPCVTAPQWVGVAVCSYSDVFNRATGRKIALTKALKQAFPSSARAALWNSYFQQAKM